MGAKAKKSIPEPILKRAEEDEFLDHDLNIESEEEQPRLNL